MSDNRISLLPSSVLAACDGEALVWAKETDLHLWIAKMSNNAKTQKKLSEILIQCFSEGVYRGALNVIDGKSLASSILESRAIHTSKDKP